MLALLSYPVTERTPLYPGTAPVELQRVGDKPPFSTSVRFDTHTSTHLDAPRHFCPGGPTVNDVLHHRNEFFPAICVDAPRQGSVGLAESDLVLPPGSESAEALLIRTGTHRLRDKDPSAYATDHPFLEPSLVRWIVQRMPRLKVLGIDCISVAHPRHEDEAREVHQALLCRRPPVLIVEDMDLSRPTLADRPFRLLLLPVLYGHLDGTPVTALAVSP